MEDLSCMRCHKRMAYARGLCITCYAYYDRRVRSGKTSWDRLVKEQKARATDSKKRKRWVWKHSAEE